MLKLVLMGVLRLKLRMLILLDRHGMRSHLWSLSGYRVIRYHSPRHHSPRHHRPRKHCRGSRRDDGGNVSRNNRGGSLSISSTISVVCAGLSCF